MAGIRGLDLRTLDWLVTHVRSAWYEADEGSEADGWER